MDGHLLLPSGRTGEEAYGWRMQTPAGLTTGPPRQGAVVVVVELVVVVEELELVVVAGGLVAGAEGPEVGTI
jgi:hypothetical protein